MDFSTLAVEIGRFTELAMDWLRSPQFYAQAGLIALAMILAWSVAAVVKTRVAPDRLGENSGASSALKRQLNYARTLIFPVLLIFALRIAYDLSNEFVQQSGLVRAAQGIALVYLIYSLIARFVSNPLLKSLFKWVVIPIAILHVIGWLDDVTGYLDSINIEIGNIRISAYGIARVVIFGSILFWLGRISNNAGQQIIRKQEGLDVGAREVAAKLFQIAVFLVIVVLLLQLMAIDLTALAVFGGALGIGLGFGLQSIASNFISGMIILLDRSVTVGDYVELEDGVSGHIRELNMRSKELLTVSRLRIIKENNERGRALGRLNVTDKDVAMITQWIEDDSVTQDMYTERLDQILELGAQADKDALAAAGLSGAGQELMNIWNEMDRGALKQEEAFEEADKAVRRRSAAKEI